MLERIGQEMGLPLLFTAILLYYAVKLLVFKDVESIRPKGRPPVRDREAYSKEAGVLILHPLLGIGLIVLGTLVMAVRFRTLEEKYVGDKH